MREALDPIGGHEVAILVQLLDVAGERQRHHVGLETVDDSTRLLAGAAVRLLDRYVVASLGFPVFGEGGVIILIKFASRIVGDVEQRHFGR